MATMQFNTGRKYTAKGQVIVAQQLPSGLILFADLSRGIDGALPLGTAFTQAAIMQAYDTGSYTWHSDAYKLRSTP